MFIRNSEPVESQNAGTIHHETTQLPPRKNNYSGFGFVKFVAGTTMFFSIIGVLFSFSMPGPTGMMVLAGAWSLLVFALVPWTLVKIGQQQKNHYEEVERHLQEL